VTLRLYNTATREVSALEPVTPGRVSIYHCGLTVQGPPHIGHIRKEVVFDVLRRWLVHEGLDVTIVANVTDIDDKILQKGAEQGRDWFAVAYENERALHQAYDVLGCIPPTYEPRATGHIPEMLQMIQALIDRGHAYVAADGSGDVYFDVRSWAAYGELSNQRIDDMQAAEDAPPEGKRDPRDFALWKGHKAGEPATAAWPTPQEWGGRPGRPGWHLECSAMAMKYLGDTLDLHAGGVDLVFPHHEDEIAQSEGASGQPFSRFWCHGEFLLIEGSKMAKRIGNVSTVADLKEQRVAGAAFRHFVFSSHYRKQLNLSGEALEGSIEAVRRVRDFHDRLAEAKGGTPEMVPIAEELERETRKALFDDLNAPEALAALFTFIRRVNAELDRRGSDAGALARAAAAFQLTNGVLDILPEAPGASEELSAWVEERIEARKRAREARDFTTADAIRAEIEGRGIAIEDGPWGTRWKATG
jgi:cysteinyl-tRNA synthetase